MSESQRTEVVGGDGHVCTLRNITYLGKVMIVIMAITIIGVKKKK